MKAIALVILGLACTAAAQTTGSLGIFEGATDVGAPAHKGSVAFDADRKEYRVTGGGDNMWGARDDFFFVWRKVTGDVVIAVALKIVTGGALAEMGDTELAPFSPMYAGLGVCAHDDKAEATAVFSDVTVEVRPPPAPAAH
jgi:hypothetical protein